MKAIVLAVGLVVLLGACAPKARTGSDSSLTEAQRDSVLGKSGLPGTSAIGRAMSTTDAESRRAADIKSQIDSLPR